MNPDSASWLTAEAQIIPDTDHHTICKFITAVDGGYRMIVSKMDLMQEELCRHDIQPTRQTEISQVNNGNSVIRDSNQVARINERPRGNIVSRDDDVPRGEHVPSGDEFQRSSPEIFVMTFRLPETSFPIVRDKRDSELKLLQNSGSSFQKLLNPIDGQYPSSLAPNAKPSTQYRTGHEIPFTTTEEAITNKEKKNDQSLAKGQSKRDDKPPLIHLTSSGLLFNKVLSEEPVSLSTEAAWNKCSLLCLGMYHDPCNINLLT